MTGTAWTEPGQGATGAKLLYAAQDAVTRGEIANPSVELGRALWGMKDHRTNLALTGAPLTADDLKRIAAAK